MAIKSIFLPSYLLIASVNRARHYPEVFSPSFIPLCLQILGIALNPRLKAILRIFVLEKIFISFDWAIGVKKNHGLDFTLLILKVNELNLAEKMRKSEKQIEQIKKIKSNNDAYN